MPTGRSWSILVAAPFIFAAFVSIDHSHGYELTTALQKELEKCCQLDNHLPFNQTDCFKLVDVELNKQAFTRTRVFRYMRKLWRFISIATNRYQNVDKSVGSWRVNGLKPVSATKNLIVFNKPTLPTVTTSVHHGSSPKRDVLTRVELLVPFYYVQPAHLCPRKVKDRRNMTVTYNGETFPAVAGTVPFRNLMVFRLPHTSKDDEEISQQKRITLNVDADLIHVHPMGSMLMKYFNMNDTITEGIQEMAVTRLQRRIMKTSTNKNDSSNDLLEKSIDPKSSKKNQTISRSSLPPMPSRFCQRQDYFLNLDSDRHMWRVVSPRKMNIGVCSGKCNTIQLYKSNEYSTGRSVVLNMITKPTKNGQYPPLSTCVPDKMLTASILFFDNMSYTSMIKNVESLTIASCRCV